MSRAVDIIPRRFRPRKKVSLLHIFNGNWTLCFITKSDPTLDLHSSPPRLVFCCIEHECWGRHHRWPDERSFGYTTRAVPTRPETPPLVYCPSIREGFGCGDDWRQPDTTNRSPHIHFPIILCHHLLHISSSQSQGGAKTVTVPRSPPPPSTIE